ncbi:hypothetical protein PSHT_00013, partial [Puccinia striiformis]
MKWNLTNSKPIDPNQEPETAPGLTEPEETDENNKCLGAVNNPARNPMIDDEDDKDLCGICRVAFGGCCPDCKVPGEDCPLTLLPSLPPLISRLCNHNHHVYAPLLTKSQFVHSDPLWSIITFFGGNALTYFTCTVSWNGLLKSQVNNPVQWTVGHGAFQDTNGMMIKYGIKGGSNRGEELNR